MKDLVFAVIRQSPPDHHHVVSQVQLDANWFAQSVGSDGTSGCYVSAARNFTSVSSAQTANHNIHPEIEHQLLIYLDLRKTKLNPTTNWLLSRFKDEATAVWTAVMS